MVKNQYGVEIDFEAAVAMMDTEIMVDMEGSIWPANQPDSDQDYFEVYCEKYMEKYGEEFEANKENPVLVGDKI